MSPKPKCFQNLHGIKSDMSKLEKSDIPKLEFHQNKTSSKL